MSRSRAITAVLVTAAVAGAGCGTDAAPGPAAETTVAPPDGSTGPTTTAAVTSTVTAGTVTADSSSTSTSSSSSTVTSSAISDGQRPPRHEATIVTDAGKVRAALVDNRLEVRLETAPGWTSQMERTDTSATIRLNGPSSPTVGSATVQTMEVQTAEVQTVEVTVEATAHGISHRVASHVSQAGDDHITWRSAADTSVSSGDEEGP